MRYEKGHKEATRKRIVAVAAKRFRKDGVEAVGLAGLMADAGLTHGGFYAHFDSKEELFREALAGALDDGLVNLARHAAADGGGIEAIVRGYLSARHRDRPDLGCAAAALAAEIARHSGATRAAFAEKLEGFIALIAAHLPAAADPPARRRRAIAIFGVMVGALQLARAVADEALSDEILKSGSEAALALARNLDA